MARDGDASVHMGLDLHTGWPKKLVHFFVRVNFMRL